MDPGLEVDVALMSVRFVEVFTFLRQHAVLRVLATIGILCYRARERS